MTGKLNRWIKRSAVPCMWAAGIASVSGIFFQHFSALPFLSDLLLILGILLAGFPILVRALQGLRFKSVGIECLVSIAVLGAFLIGELSEAAVVTFLFQFGSWLEQKTMRKTRSAVKALTEAAPSTAWRLEGETWEEIDAEEVEEGDRLLVKTGLKIAVDGTVLEGEGYVNEAGITGESLPVYKQCGDPLYAGTILENGTLQMRADRVGEDTTFSRIIALVEEAQDAKSPLERFIDRFAVFYTPAVVLLSALVFLIGRNADTAITVLVLACPGALVIGAPIANVAGIGCGAQKGILFKGGDCIYTFAKTDTVVFDKTGTLTQGQPEVLKVYVYGAEEAEALRLAASAEAAADHPLGKAVLRYAKKKEIPFPMPQKADLQNGMGIRAVTEGQNIWVGNLRMMKESGSEIPDAVYKDLEACSGCSTVFAAYGGRVVLLLAIADEVRKEARDCVRELKALGIRQILMLTGDHRSPAQAAADAVGIDEVYERLLPEDKMEKIRVLQKERHVVTFIGDGINDSPAITAADTGIAMGNGTDAALDSSDIVLIGSDLKRVAAALRIAGKTKAVMYENMVIAIGTVLFLLAGLLTGYIHMAAGMLVHEASILAVILNAMRIFIYEKEEK